MAPVVLFGCAILSLETSVLQAQDFKPSTVFAKKKPVHKSGAGGRLQTSSPSSTASDLNSPAMNFSGVEPLVDGPNEEQQLSPREAKHRAYFDQAPN